MRPEDVALHANGAGAISAVVDVVEPLGSEQVLYFTAGGQLTAPAHATIAAGDTIALSINPDRMHLFDTTTGAAYF